MLPNSSPNVIKITQKLNSPNYHNAGLNLHKNPKNQKLHVRTMFNPQKVIYCFCALETLSGPRSKLTHDPYNKNPFIISEECYKSLIKVTNSIHFLT